MLFADHALARRLEGADAQANAAFAPVHARLYPDVGATVESVAGGYAIYAGASSPLTQAIGLGMHGPVRAAELARLEDFYWQRGATVHVELCPLADSSLPALLAERGYRAEEYSNVLARPLHPGETATAPSGGVHVRVPAADEAELWVRTVAAGFAEDEEVAPTMRPIFMTYFHMPAATCFLASVDGQPAGGGVVATRDGVAALFATSTRMAFRKRGVQAALIWARLDFASRAGCDVAMVMTAPGTTSQRNVERQGFHVMYTRTKMLRELDTTGDGLACRVARHVVDQCSE
jgi:hypothetical protein